MSAFIGRGNLCPSKTFMCIYKLDLGQNAGMFLALLSALVAAFSFVLPVASCISAFLHSTRICLR